jgi:exopolysaccharide production protein ExoQ
LWSPYALSSVGLTLAFFCTVLIGVALVSVNTVDELVTHASTALRAILASSLVFEIVVGLRGVPLYPVGMDAPPGTSIELAWCRAIFFESGGRIQGIVGNANLLGMLALLALVIAVVRIAARETRTWAIVDAVLAGILLVKTASTTVALAAVAVAGVWLLVWLARRRQLFARLSIGAILTAAVGAVVVALTNWTTVTAALGKSPDLTNRFGIWQAVLERINVRPVTGFGFVGWWPTWEGWFGIHAIRNIRVQQAHNVWLDLTMQIGIIGTVLFAIALVSTGWLLWRGAVRDAGAVALISIGIFVAMVVQTLTESRILTEWGIAMFVILSIAARRTQSLDAPRP